MPHRSSRWIWAGRIVFLLVLAGLIIYFTRVGLDQADKLASTIGLLVALAALAAPYLLPAPPAGPAPTGPVTAAGAGAVAVGGDSEDAISTDVSGVDVAAAPPPSGDGVHAAGAGSVVVGGNNKGPIRTHVRGAGSPPTNPQP